MSIDTRAVEQNTVLIAVIGKAGVGKSSFINSVLGRDLANVDSGGIGSCTQFIAAYHTPLTDGRDLIIVDTPGFDGYRPSESGSLTEGAPSRDDILRMVVGFLGEAASDRRFSYVFVIESVTDEEPVSDLTVTFKRKMKELISGTRVALVSTHWDELLIGDNEELEERESMMHGNGSLSKFLMNTVEDIQMRRSGMQVNATVSGYTSPPDLVCELVGARVQGTVVKNVNTAPTGDGCDADWRPPPTSESVTPGKATSEGTNAPCSACAHNQKKAENYEHLIREAVGRETAALSAEIARLKLMAEEMKTEHRSFCDHQKAKAESQLAELSASAQKAQQSLAKENKALKVNVAEMQGEIEIIRASQAQTQASGEAKIAQRTASFKKIRETLIKENAALSASVLSSRSECEELRRVQAQTKAKAASDLAQRTTRFKQVEESLKNEKAALEGRILTMKEQHVTFRRLQAQKQADAESEINSLKESLQNLSLPADEWPCGILDGCAYTIRHKQTGLYVTMRINPSHGYGYVDLEPLITGSRTVPYSYRQLWIFQTNSRGYSWKIESKQYREHFIVPAVLDQTVPRDVVSRKYTGDAIGRLAMWKLTPVSLDDDGEFYIQLLNKVGELTPWAQTAGVRNKILTDQWQGGTDEEIWVITLV